MSVSKFSLNIRKISLISSVALAYSTPLMAGWNIDVTFLKDTSESTLNTLRVKCLNRLERQNDKKGSLEKWFARYTKLEEIKTFHNPSLETIKEYLIEKEQFKEGKKEEVSKPSQPTILSSVNEEIENLKLILQLDSTSEDVSATVERLLLLQDAQQRGVTHYLSDADLIQPPQPVAKNKKESLKKKDAFQVSQDDLLSEFQRKFGPKNQVRHPAALSLFTGIQGNIPPKMEEEEKKEVKKPLNLEREKEENPLSKPLNPPGANGKKEQKNEKKEARPLAPSSVSEEIKKLERTLLDNDGAEDAVNIEKLFLLLEAQKRGIMHYSSEEDLKPSPSNQLLSELKRRYGNPQEQVHNPFAISRFTRIQGNDPSIKDQVLESIGEGKGVEKAKKAKEVKNKEDIYHGDYNSVLEELLKKHDQLLKKPNSQQQEHPPHAFALVKPIEEEKGKLEVKEEEDKEQQASKSIINKEHEKKEKPLLRALNSQFDMDEKTALPKGWKLVDSSKNRDISKPVALKKKTLGVEVLGDNYTFYTDMPSLDNYDQTTFLFSVELRGTKPGTYIQYWDGVKSVSSAPYNGNRKGDWETLSVEFTVDAQKARFHRLYAAIMGATKGMDNPSVDVRSVKLEPKQL